MKRIFNQIIFTSILLTGLLQCSNSDEGDQRSMEISILSDTDTANKNKNISFISWLRENELRVIKALKKRVTISDSMNSGVNYIEKTIVVTEYDTSILGELAKKIKLIDSTLIVHYTVTPNFVDKPIIKAKPSPTLEYEDLNWKSNKRIEMGQLVLEYSDSTAFEKERKWN